MPGRLQDSVVVITGASSGIGRASALEFARRGATVVLAVRAIVRLVEHPKREVAIGDAGRMVIPLHRLMPGLAERLMARQVESAHFQDLPAPPSLGNLFEPMPNGPKSTGGGWKRPVPMALPRQFATFGLAVLVPALLAWLWLRPSSHGQS